LLRALASGTERAYRWFEANVRPEETLILNHPFVLGAKIASENLGIPYVPMMYAPSQLQSVLRPALTKDLPTLQDMSPSQRRRMNWVVERAFVDRVLGPEIHRLRKQLGLPGRVQRILYHWMPSGEQRLGLWPLWFFASPADWTEVFLTGFIFHETDERLDPVV